MDNAQLIGLSKQMALQHQMDVVANNMANIETAGFKGEHLVFEEYIMPQAEVSGMTGQDQQLTYVYDARLFREFSEGSFAPTGNPLDVAINGKGWFVIETENGERYTRNGHFKLNASGELVTSSGQRVLGESGPITFTAEDIKISISKDGTISSSEGEKGKLRIVAFANEAQLKKTGGNLFSSEAAPIAAEKYSLAQGVIERSNVKPVVEMTRMIEVMRSYTSTARLLQNLSELQRRAIERLGEAPV